VQNSPHTSVKIAPNNIDNKIDNNIIDSIDDVATESQTAPDPKTEPKEIRHKYQALFQKNKKIFYILKDYSRFL